ncbi:Lrp/AsnC family transcriptional regulator [Roseicella frigidaeris]|uniref:Lrp/AsnC family transcriptional regulator n=1 Tax=Roseicella frigidaeris TaxID=2230885 RepID=UPI0014031E2E|nr:Lrp/AsnC family transcriptional regulator [Roseicella frigidaeris]
MVPLDETDRRLLDDFQRDLPLEPRPYAAMARELGLEEAEVIARLAALQDCGAISRIGAVVRPNTAGRSTLAAMAVPADRLEEVGALVAALPEVNHCYEREHRLNLWFVVTAAGAVGVAAALARAAAATGLPVLDLPLEAEYRIDLGFPLRWT